MSAGASTRGARPGRGGVATLADVAAEAGVSTVAASVVVNGSKSGARVSTRTRERIMKAATALEYRPNAVARSLRQKRTNIIGFYSVHGTVLDPRYPFYAGILSGLQAGCEEHHKDLLVHGTFRGRSDDNIFQELLNGQVDALVLYARVVTPVVERLASSRLPVITVVNEVRDVPCVDIDHAAGGRLLACHLAEKGYRKVLYRRTAADLLATLESRMRSFCDEAQGRGLTLMHSRCDGDWPTPEEQEMLLAGNRRPDAVACWSDYSADGIVEFCRRQGLRVPQDVAVVGFDDLPSTRRPSSRLTTVHAPWLEVARVAVGLLVAQFEGKEVPQRTVIPVHLVVGDTA